MGTGPESHTTSHVARSRSTYRTLFRPTDATPRYHRSDDRFTAPLALAPHWPSSFVQTTTELPASETRNANCWCRALCTLDQTVWLLPAFLTGRKSYCR